MDIANKTASRSHFNTLLHKETRVKISKDELKIQMIIQGDFADLLVVSLVCLIGGLRFKSLAVVPYGLFSKFRKYKLLQRG